jgi:spermidine/putrescine transport system permease protein
MASTRINFTERRRHGQTRVLVLPAAVWMVVFFVLPLLVVLAYSFLTPSRLYQAVAPVTFTNYTKILDETFISVMLRSIGTAINTTLLCAIIGYPMAYFVATREKRWRNLFLMLVIVPFWTNFVVRTYAIVFTINEGGLLNSLFVDYLRIISTPLDLLYTPFAVYFGLIYGYLPFMILPMYTSIEKFNFRLMEAAADLGANDLRAFWRVMLPATLPGIWAGCILVFIPALGSYITPDLLGGAKFQMMGNQIKTFMDSPTGKPSGAALSVVMMAVVVVALIFYYRFADRDARSVG